MDDKLQLKLNQFQSLVSLETGERGVPVALQYGPSLGECSRTERRRLLETKFDEIRSRRLGEDIRLDLKTLSVSGQTVEGTISLDRFKEVEKDLAQVGVRVDVLFPHQVTQ